GIADWRIVGMHGEGPSLTNLASRRAFGRTAGAIGLAGAASRLGFPPVIGAASRVSFAHGMDPALLDHRRDAAVAAAVDATIGATFAHDGITCQAGLAATLAQGFFRDEGLDVTVVPSPPDVRAQVAQGNIDAGHAIAWTLVPPMLPAGLNVGDVVATAGVQRGGLALVVAPESPIRRIADLLGQKVAAALSWRIMLADPLSRLGANPATDVDWQAALPGGQIADALRTGQVAAATLSDPVATAMETAGTVRILTMNNGPGMMDDYCCSVAVGAPLLRADRSKVVAITRAVMRGNAWAQANKAAAAQLQIELGHVTASLADNLRAIQAVDFTPSVSLARRDTQDMLMHAARFGFIDPATDVLGVLSRIFVPVTGELLRLPATGDAEPEQPVDATGA
ncbi:MAG: ABC transporter substrate-binding protein, partial [Chloroflexota bacterium]